MMWIVDATYRLAVDSIYPPADPPAYQLILTVMLTLVIGTAILVGIKKLRNSRRANMLIP